MTDIYYKTQYYSKRGQEIWQAFSELHEALAKAKKLTDSGEALYVNIYEGTHRVEEKIGVIRKGSIK